MRRPGRATTSASDSCRRIDERAAPVWFGELDEPHIEGPLRVRGLDPELVWLADEHNPWQPSNG
jgi:hypothetical protein